MPAATEEEVRRLSGFSSWWGTVRLIPVLIGKGSLQGFPVTLKPLAVGLAMILMAASMKALALKACYPLGLPFAFASVTHAALLTSMLAGSP